MQGNPLLLLPILGPALLGVVALLADRYRPRRRDGLVVAGLALCLLVALGLALPVLRGGGEQALSLDGVLGLGLSLRLDGFRALYALVTALLWLGSGVFSREYFAHSHKLGRYWFSCLLTLGAAMGVFLSSSLFTAFVFLEVMSFASYPMVAHEESGDALRAAGTYLTVAVVCGMVTLMGLLMLHAGTGTLEIDALHALCATVADRSALLLPGVLILVGFGAKAGMFPLQVWLPKAHPVAPAPASALLSGVLTKTGIFGVLALSGSVFLRDADWGLLLLFPALATMLLGALLALLSNDLKRTLACSSVSQIGFVLTGISMQGLLGEHNALAVRGTLLHMVNHSLFKLVLFLAAGVVSMNLHKLDLNDIRGFGRGRPLFSLVFLSGALGIAGVPGWSGYVSKTLLHESLVEAIELYAGSPLAGLLRGGEIIFLFCGGLTAAYMAKLCAALLLDKPSQAVRKCGGRTASPASMAAMLIPAAALPALGCAPRLMESVAALGEGFLHGHAPGHAVHYFDPVNLRGAAISLAVGGLVYFGVVRTLLSKAEPDGSRRYVVPVGGQLFVWLFEVMPGRVLHRLVSTLSAPARPKPYPGHFFSRFYWLFYPREDKSREPALTGGGISFSLLLFSAGMTVLLVYVLLRSLL